MNKNKTVKIQDVAKFAGVSTATVSRVLSHPERVTERTKSKVTEAIYATGYRVNHAARNLRTQRADAVLILVPNLGNPFFSQILAGISAHFADTSYSVLITDTNEETDDNYLIDYFLDNRVGGMISLDGSLTLAQIDILEKHGFRDRLVFACEWVHGCTLPSVRSDNVKGACMAIRHLYELGHRKIAHVTGPEDNVLTMARREGAALERKRLNLPMRDEWILRGDFSISSGRKAGSAITAMSDRPTAVFCVSDMVAFGLISRLQEENIRVPQDISVVGFDDIEISANFIPSLTTIRQDRRRLGIQASALLLDRLTNEAKLDPGSITELVDVTLVPRGSSACLEHFVVK